MASWFLCSSQDQAVRAQALGEDIALCFGARYFTALAVSFRPGPSCAKAG